MTARRPLHVEDVRDQRLPRAALDRRRGSRLLVAIPAVAATSAAIAVAAGAISSTLSVNTLAEAEPPALVKILILNGLKPRRHALCVPPPLAPRSDRPIERLCLPLDLLERHLLELLVRVDLDGAARHGTFSFNHALRVFPVTVAVDGEADRGRHAGLELHASQANRRLACVDFADSRGPGLVDDTEPNRGSESGGASSTLRLLCLALLFPRLPRSFGQHRLFSRRCRRCRRFLGLGGIHRSSEHQSYHVGI